MQNGIYHLRFSSAGGNAGEGLAVIKDGAVNGGDLGYLYAGSLMVSENGLNGHFSITQWNATVPSIFGPLRAFKLDLTGTATPESFTVAGGVAGQPALRITIVGRRLSPAA